MTDTRKNAKGYSGCTIGCFTALIIFGFFAILLVGSTWLLEIPFLIIFGWIPYLMRVIPEVEVSTAGCVQAAILLMLLIVVAHLFFRWFYAAFQRTRDSKKEDAPQPRKWRFRWTLTSIAVVTLLFISGISLSAIVHQVNWIARSPEPLTRKYGYARSANNMRQLVMAIRQHDEEKGSFPPGTTYNENGSQRHGWLTQILPYIEQNNLYKLCNLDARWNDPKNAEAMKIELDTFHNPTLSNAPTKDENGFALSHYATNSRVIGPGPAMTFDQITDGESTTLLMGEVNHDFLPWGHPQNWRDPAIGLNVPGGFGGASRNYTQFLFCDGSARRINNDIDPAVLRALATPAAGDDPGTPADWDD